MALTMYYLIVIIVMLQVFTVENRFVSFKYETEPPSRGEVSAEEVIFEKKILSFENENGSERTEYDFDSDLLEESMKKPCTIMLVSNIQDPTMQSLLRKYRYDANGVLIPSSVKYFIKKPQGLRTTPILVPLNDKAFSPHGGFVRYYKEVPPIPRIS